MKINTEKTQEIKSLNKEIVQFEKKAGVPEIKNEKDFKIVAENLIIAKDKFKKAEEFRKFIVQPLNDQVSKINDRFKEITEPLGKFEKLAKDCILYFRKESEKSRLNKQEKLEEEWKKKGKKNGEIMPILEEQPTKIRTDVGDLVFKKETEIKIINKKKIPKEYWSVDFKKIKDALKENKEIPGIKVELNENVSVYTDIE